MKKTICILLSLLMILALVPAGATVGASDEFLKASLSDYISQGINVTSRQLMSFDNKNSSWGGISGAYTDTLSRKEGSGSLSMTVNSTSSSVKTLFSSESSKPFSISITNKRTQTLKMWVYVSDVDLIACDHDTVYDYDQKNCGTFWITIGNYGKAGAHTWQHTFYSSGWHEMELSFNCHNTAYSTYLATDYTALNYIKIAGICTAGLTVKLDDLRIVNYSNPGYVRPDAPDSGRWISTCDAESLDGGILTEWFNCDFDTTRKTQGSSSFKVTGHKEHVDFRGCFGGFSVPVSWSSDAFCFDVYVENPDLMGGDWQFRLEEYAPHVAYYSFGYTEVDAWANGGQGLTTGWNSVKIPIYAMSVNNNTAYHDASDKDLTLSFMTAFIAGTSETTDYTVWYDNMYIAALDELGLPSAPTGEEGEVKLVSTDEQWSGGTWNTTDYVIGSASRQTKFVSANGAIVLSKTFAQDEVLKGGDTISLWYYVSDKSSLSTICLEFSSSGSYSSNCARYQWSNGVSGYSTASLKNGWNLLTMTVPESGPTAAGIVENGYRLYLGSGQTDDMAPDWSAINYVRFFTFVTSASCSNPVTVAYNGLSFDKRYIADSGESYIRGTGEWDSENAKDGTASYSKSFTAASGSVAVMSMTLPDKLSLTPENYVGMWVYVSDISLVREIFFEFSSSGTYSKNCARYLYSVNFPGTSPQDNLETGWNYLRFYVPEQGPDTTGIYRNGYRLYLGSGQTDDMAPDWSAINYVRLCINCTGTSENPLTVKYNAMSVGTRLDAAACGDVNADGEITIVDSICLQRYNASWTEYNAQTLSISAADINADGLITAVDCILLMRHLSCWSGYETLPYIQN